jgi:hypothetical protein
MTDDPDGRVRIVDAEGATFRPAGEGETLRLQYHRGMKLWRELAAAGHRRGKAS